ncbi:peptidoglycan DD-metalloendopeptidase family protein [Bradyrhizobium sp. BRP22]|uniref:M23 family metallopeptidase n=1 Tax=Bradyrhizobium sp. BRP22 TaxID=2793821 RepID=UPI001CD4830D|nr:M23 family metallopeptidase [Bradyrhizobium sp. BRP22]MCA1453859.1 peptidoglycan DD-metalloendopeptidase family protein [Bradyrhizobium sp. BRP22]
MKGKAVRFVAFWLAAFASFLASPLAASADEFRTPSISAVRVEWRAVLDQLRAEINTQPSIAANFSFASQRRVPSYDPRSRPALVQLNAITSQLFPGIGRSPIPVLLPFDTASYLEARQGSASQSLSVSRYQADFRPADLFHAGAAGYDAMFALEPGAGEMPERTFARPVEVHITGSLLLYDLNDRLGGKGEPVKSLSAQYPDIRRVIREGYVRYAFTRFGVPYVVSIHCLDSVPRLRRLACREAYPVAERFLKALRVTGGQPARVRRDIASISAERPATASPDFTYRPSGDIVANSGYRKQAGRTDLTAYSQIRFPLAKAPAFVHSQSFGRRADQYPWQDNFCEARSFEVGQCATGFGHQGQDIRPGACPPNKEGEPCDPKRQAVVAVRDGVVIRSPGQQGATLQVNTQTEHIRFRYMHMNPSAMDADGLLNGRRVTEGEKIGVVSNYLDHPNGTTRHLHFDVQVFTRDGWLWVNPYTTLVSAYERLIRGRGREIGPEPPAAAAVAHAQPEDVIQRLDPQEGGGN